VTRQEIAELRARAERWLAEHPREGDFAVTVRKPKSRKR
jgi:hypothetical protein